MDRFQTHRLGDIKDGIVGPGDFLGHCHYCNKPHVSKEDLVMPYYCGTLCAKCAYNLFGPPNLFRPRSYP